jgi:hypothetical protein
VYADENVASVVLGYMNTIDMGSSVRRKKNIHARDIGQSPVKRPSLHETKLGPLESRVLKW